MACFFRLCVFCASRPRITCHGQGPAVFIHLATPGKTSTSTVVSRPRRIIHSGHSLAHASCCVYARLFGWSQQGGLVRLSGVTMLAVKPRFKLMPRRCVCDRSAMVAPRQMHSNRAICPNFPPPVPHGYRKYCTIWPHRAFSLAGFGQKPKT